MWNRLVCGTSRLSVGATVQTTSKATIKAVQPLPLNTGDFEGSSICCIESSEKRSERAELGLRSGAVRQYGEHRRHEIGARSSFAGGSVHASALRPFMAKMP